MTDIAVGGARAAREPVLLALLPFPEPRATSGPDGPRFVRVSDAVPPPIVAADGRR